MMEDLIITPVDARVMLAIGKAVKEHYRIERCEVLRRSPSVLESLGALALLPLRSSARARGRRAA